MMTIKLSELLHALDMGEDQEIEFKTADGGLPKSIWETISGFANTYGGHIILGVSQIGDAFAVVGVRNPEALIKMFWDTHNSTQKINIPVCQFDDVYVLPIQSQRLVVIAVPPATRQQRPVFINGNPFLGTYKRNFEGDYRCNETEVKQLLRDASEEPADSMILDGFDWADFDKETVAAYRNRFVSRTPNHPFLALSDQMMLTQLGAWRKDRRNKREGVTLAGLLMFGKELSILDALPHYHLDYQERLSDDPEVRWTFRLTLDGNWVPNLFNCYYRVYTRLVENIEVPFKLDQTSVRREETSVHEALREGLVNTLVHADHQSTKSISIIKLKNSFEFVNPGRLRIPKEQLYQGGVSDPRNPTLLKMFQMIGLGEKSGSGFPKILRAWNEQHWLKPTVFEDINMELIRIVLPLLSLIPEDIEHAVCSVVGAATYREMDERDRTILLLIQRFGELGNEDIQSHVDSHPKEIWSRLSSFSDRGWLEKYGHGRGTKYRWPRIAKVDKRMLSPEHMLKQERGAKSEHLDARSEHLDARSEHLPSDIRNKLQAIAAVVSSSGKVSKVLMEKTILELCTFDWLSMHFLAELLNRNPDSLRNHYIKPMLKDGRLSARVPGKPNHPNQAYRNLGDG